MGRVNGFLSNGIIIQFKQNMSLHTSFLRSRSIEYRIVKENGLMFTVKTEGDDDDS